MIAVTQWFRGNPPRAGWWDTKRKHYLFGTDYEIRLWWTGRDWRASPSSPNSCFDEVRQWRGLAEQPEAA